MRKLIYILLLFIFNLNIKAQWGSDVRLTNDPIGSYTSYSRCIATFGNNVHVVWHDFRSGFVDIYYKRSIDGGNNWSQDVRLSTNAGQSHHPSIAVNGSQVHVSWNDNSDGNLEIYYKRSTDNGLSWEEDIRLTNNSSTSDFCSLSLSGSLVNVAWHDNRDGNWEIYYKYSTNNGVTWSSDLRLTNNFAESFYPSLVTSNQSTHVVWEDNRDGNFEIYFKSSFDGGVNWGPDKRLTNNLLDSKDPSLSISGPVLFVSWHDNSFGDWNIFYKYSLDNGTSWSADQQLSNGGGSVRSSVCLSGQNVHIVWDNSLNREIYYRRSQDLGTSWDAETQLTNYHSSIIPCLSISGSSVHVVWTDYRDGDTEIYYKSNPTHNTPITLSTGLVSYYPFNGNTNDESGNNNHGINSGATLTSNINGISNKAYYFNGNNNNINIPDLNINNPENISLHALIFPERFNNESILYYGEGGEMQIAIENNKIDVRIKLSDLNWYIASDPNPTEQRWYSIVGVWQKGNSLKLYVNGQLEREISVPNIGIWSAFGYHAYIGDRHIIGSNPFKGKIDEVRTYSRALSQSEIQQLYNLIQIPISQPSISISPIQINPGGSVNISGQNFRANAQVKVSVISSNSENVLEQTIPTNSNGGFSANYSSNINSSPGIYTVTCYDINSYQSAANKIFEIKQGQEVFFLNLTSPNSYTVNRNINVEWKDKMIPKPGYPINNIKRYYKYKINYTTDNGSTWSADEISEGYEFINSTPVLRKQITLPPPVKILSGAEVNIKVTDFIDQSRFSESGNVSILDNYLTKSSVNLIWDYSYPDRSGKPIGVCADGVSRFYIKVSNLPGNTITGISANLTDDLNSSSERVLGKLIIANETEGYSNEASSAHLTNYVDNSSKDDYWIWYVSPDDFNRYGASDDSNIERVVNLNITVNYSTGPPETSVVGINIIRQPLMLVHGINSDHHVWDYFRSNKNIDNLFKFVSTPDMDPKGKFIDNGYLLLNWGQTSTVYAQSFRYIINKARQSGYASNQVSYVAHSMGGSMLRAASETYFYKSNYNYQKGFVNRFISVDTPHEGSPLADFLVDFLYYFGGALNIFLDESYNSFFIFDANNKIKPSPAVVNLQTDGFGKFYFNETKIPTFLAAGDFFPGTDDNLNNIDWNYSYNNKFNKLLNILDNFLTISTTEILYSLFYKVLDYSKVKAIMLNPFMKKTERVFKLLNLVYSKFFESSSFLPNSDFVVPVNSQLAGIQRTSNNTFDRFNGNNNLPGVSHTYVYSCTEDNVIANKIIEHLNLPTYDNGFTQVIRSTPITNNSPVSGNSIPLNQNFDFDQSDDITITNPQNGQNFFIDSVLNLSFNLVDTTDLKFVKVYFQGESYFDTAKSLTYNFNLTINGNKLDSCDLIVYAAYINDSTIDFKTDIKRIFIKTNYPVLDFQVKNDFYFLSKDQIITPSYKSVFSNTIYEGSLSSITAIVDDPSVIQFNSAGKTFKGVSTGETFAVVSNGGPSDTIYFSINGEILTPAITTLVYPPDSAKVNKANLKLSWNIVNYASNYYLEVAKDINFESVVYENSSLNDTITTITDIVDSVTYYWRVKGVNSTGSGEWSEIRNFIALPLKKSYFIVNILTQGFYNETTNTLNRSDTVTAYLMNSTPPFNVIDSSRTVIKPVIFECTFEFDNAPTGNYMIKVNHMNSIETWSKASGELFTNESKNYYDFTKSETQAFGNNMILKGTKYCIYSGDVNQDGSIDLTDVVSINNDATVFSSGFLVTDLNGDYITDLTDLLLGFNNSSMFIMKITP